MTRAIIDGGRFVFGYSSAGLMFICGLHGYLSELVSCIPIYVSGGLFSSLYSSVSAILCNFVRFNAFYGDMKEGMKASLHQILTDYLELNNYRKTPERYAILDAVYSINGHFTLEELSDKLSGECHFPVSRGTLYNTLKLFMELRLVLRHRFQGSTKYEACYNNGCHSHQVCTICGKVVEIKSSEISAAINELHLKRFRKDGYSLYIYGVCSACQAKITRKKSNEIKLKSQKDKK